jgi:hypothetical protein
MADYDAWLSERDETDSENNRKLYKLESTPRPLYVIAREIVATWPRPYFGAVPYINAMAELVSVRDNYGHDTAGGIVRYFLVNARTWRGEDAKRIKAELKGMLS